MFDVILSVVRDDQVLSSVGGKFDRLIDAIDYAKHPEFPDSTIRVVRDLRLKGRVKIVEVY